MKTIYSNQSRTVLELIKDKIESEGIKCFIRNEFPPAAGQIPPVSACPALCVMDDSQIEKAKAILQEILKEETSEPAQSWICPQCHAEVPGELKICWQCGYIIEE